MRMSLIDRNGMSGMRRSWPKVTPFLPKMRERLYGSQGLLLGESAVLSTCVHVMQAWRPSIISILSDTDAGRTFYNRSRTGEILHLDVFHSPGNVDHRLVAANLRAAIADYECQVWPGLLPGGGLADFVDVQTATGGGRITGSLRYGRKATLRRAHRNHVHVAMRWHDDNLICIMHVLAATERAILASGLELRRVDGLVHERGGGRPLPLDDYTSYSDSMLRERGGRSGSRGGSGSGSGAGSGGNPDSDRGGDGTGGSSEGYADGEHGERGRSLPDADWAELHATAVGLARHFGSEEHAQALLELLKGAPPLRDVLQALTSRGIDSHVLETALKELTGKGLVENKQGVFRLTRRGIYLADYVANHGRELRLALRKAMRRSAQRDGFQEGRSPVRGCVDRSGAARGRVAVAPEPGMPLQEVAWPETVVTAAARGRIDREPFRLEPDDLRVVQRRRRRPVDICLLIDASASMAGERMRAAKTLARHLLTATRDRVAVVVFQERQVRVTVPFTRNDVKIEQGLATIRPYGLTPLASGLAVARQYLSGARCRNPLLLLITDGIPTVPHDGSNPLEDAMTQARQWRGGRASLTCVGLQPNERYLRGLVETAGGSLHIVDELEADTLVSIAIAERRRLSRI